MALPYTAGAPSGTRREPLMEIRSHQRFGTFQRFTVACDLGAGPGSFLPLVIPSTCVERTGGPYPRSAYTGRA